MGDAKRRRQNKMKLTMRMAASLRLMLKDESIEFVCPICEKQYDISDDINITYGHIIPKAAGKDITTLICKSCNSNSGHSIDKWFGELVRLLEKDDSIFETKYQDRDILVDGIRVAGKVHRTKDGAFEIFIYNDRTSPDALEELHKRAKIGLKSLQFSFPLLKNDRLVNLGALQAGYLMLIKAFGYTPMLQKSLDIVRLQLCNTSEDILDSQFVASAKAGPGIAVGIAEISGKICLYSLFHKIIIFYPTSEDGDDFYDLLPRDYKNTDIKVYPFRSYEIPENGSAIGLIVGKKFVVWPDKAKCIPKDFTIAYLDKPDGVVVFMNRISEKDAEEFKSKEDHQVESIRIQLPPSFGL